MIRKLRRQFVAVCMALVALVLAAVFGSAYHAVRQNIEDLSRQMLQQVLTADNGRGASPGMTIEIGGDQILLPYFTVNIWGDTAYITGGTYADLEDTDVLKDILSQCLAQGTAEGVINDYHLRYLVQNNGLYRKLAFVDMSMEQAVLIRLVRSYLVIALAAMLALLAIAVAASHWVTRPVERAWKQQRQFLSDASHELKTPLTVILSNAELLEGAGLTDKPARWSGNIRLEAVEKVERKGMGGAEAVVRVKNGTGYKLVLERAKVDLFYAGSRVMSIILHGRVEVPRRTTGSFTSLWRVRTTDPMAYYVMVKKIREDDISQVAVSFAVEGRGGPASVKNSEEMVPLSEFLNIFGLSLQDVKNYLDE